MCVCVCVCVCVSVYTTGFKCALIGDSYRFLDANTVVVSGLCGLTLLRVDMQNIAGIREGDPKVLLNVTVVTREGF